MGECKVKSFRAKWSDWKISWRWTTGGKSTIVLPVEFTLELEPGSTKADCTFVQKKRGRMQYDNTKADVFPTWIADGDIGENIWWDGTRMARTGKGEWDSSGTKATFQDEPGLQKATGRLYMGDADGGSGYFDFWTFVSDRASSKIIAEIHWSMRIDVPNPGSGGSWWSYSDQK